MQPLEGIRVLDLTHVIAGPLATHQLRALGAEVIKIERPLLGDSIRSLAAQPELEGLTPAFRAFNIGKKSVEIDLKSAEGRDAVLALAATADVFVENFRPGVAKRLGLSASDIRKVRPAVIYCSISGWGQSGPRAETPAYDHVIQAATGMMALQGNGDADAPPIKVGFPVIDSATGMQAATAIVAAVLRRARGDSSPIELDISMVDSALVLMSSTVAITRAAGKAPVPAGNRGFVGSPGAETLPTKDGHISVAANTFIQFCNLCNVLGCPELTKPPYLPAGLPDDAFLTNMASDTLRHKLIIELQRFETSDLERQLLEVGVPASKVRNLHEYMTELYPQTPGVDIPGGDGVLGSGFRWLGETEPEIDPAPRLGQHNRNFRESA
ncbi:MAG: CoA transferase [Chloroflexota bacterium]